MLPGRNRVVTIAVVLAMLIALSTSTGKQARAQAPSAGMSVTYPAGWSLAAFPANTDLAGAVGPLYTLLPFDSAYTPVQLSDVTKASVCSAFLAPRCEPPLPTCVVSCGFWAYFPAPTRITLTSGNPGYPSYRVSVPAGQWLMVGDPSSTAPASVSGADAVYVYDPASGYHTSTTLQPGQGAWAYSAAGALVSVTPSSATPSTMPAIDGGGTLLTLDPATNAVAAADLLGGVPYSMSINSATHTIFLVDSYFSYLRLLRLGETGDMGSTPIPFLTTVVAANSATNTVYALDSSDNSVSVIDGASGAVITTIPFRSRTGGIGVNPSTNTVYIANPSDNTVSVIDGTTNAITTTISVGPEPGAISVNPSTNTLYVVHGGDPYHDYLGMVSVIDGATNTVTAAIPVGAEPGAAAVNPDTNTIYVPNGIDRTISVISGDTNTVTAVVPVGTGPDTVAASASTDAVYVGNSDGTVSVIDGKTNAVSTTLTFGSNTIVRAIRADPTTGSVYVLKSGR